MLKSSKLMSPNCIIVDKEIGQPLFAWFGSLAWKHSVNDSRFFVVLVLEPLQGKIPGSIPGTPFRNVIQPNPS